MPFGYAPFPPVTGGQVDTAEMPSGMHPRKLQGAKGDPQQCHSSFAPASFGASFRAQKCQGINAPREGFNIQTQVMSTKCQSFPNNLQGAIEATQKCYGVCAPTSFIWCRDYLAEMPLLTRTKGRAKILLQKCHVTNALPNQLQGFNAQSQKCHNAHNPRKGAI